MTLPKTITMSTAETHFNRWTRQEYSKIKPGLERILKFFRITNREKDISSDGGLPVIHIAGTNGKGSVASFIASILQASGLKTGLYTSPHLIALTERIKLNGKDITADDLERYFKNFATAIRASRLTFFEAMTALAIIYFTDKKADVLVMEVGVGGGLDATNVCSNKALSIITTISKDHTDLFGNDIKNIAREDIGIIKEEKPLVVGKLDNFLTKMIRAESRAKNSIGYFYGKNFVSANTRADWKNLCIGFDYIEKSNDGKPLKLKNLKIRLMGAYQARNAALAIKSALILKSYGEKFRKITPRTIRDGLFKAKWPARFEIRQNPKKRSWLIIDGAHNEEAVSNFVREYTRSPFYKMKTRVVFASLKEKDHGAMAKILSNIADEVSILKLSSPRAQKPAVIKDAFLKASKSKRLKCQNIRITQDIRSALSPDSNTVIVLIGSLYLAGEGLKMLKENETKLFINC